MPKATLVVLTALVTIGLTLAYATVDEQRFSIYLPHATKGLTDNPGPTSLDDRVLALETQVARLSGLLTPTPVPTVAPSPAATPFPTPTPWYQTVKADDYNGAGGPFARSLGPYRVEIAVPPSVSDSAGTNWPSGTYSVPITFTVTYGGAPVAGAVVRYWWITMGCGSTYPSGPMYPLNCDSSIGIWSEVTTNAGGTATGTLGLNDDQFGSFVNIQIRITTGEVKLMTLKTIRLE